MRHTGQDPATSTSAMALLPTAQLHHYSPACSPYEYARPENPLRVVVVLSRICLLAVLEPPDPVLRTHGVGILPMFVVVQDVQRERESQ